MYLRSKKKTAREISLYEPIGTDKEGNEIHLLDIVEGGGEDIAEQYNRKEDAVRLYCYLDSELKEQEKQVLLLDPRHVRTADAEPGSDLFLCVFCFSAKAIPEKKHLFFLLF